jgi:hypothetical protein
LTVGQLIERLSQFDPYMEVTITDGYQAVGYEGDFFIQEFEGTVDIGVGGLNVIE